MTDFKSRFENFIETRFFIYILLFVIGIFTCVMAWFNEVCEGGGDNIWHYYFSKYAFQFPKYFLHHWGKPFYILLTAPVAQMGFYAVKVFNIICGLVSAYIAYCWCKKIGLKYAFAVVIFILFSPIYFASITTALTEPLFSLVVIWSAYLFYFKKYFWGALIASLLMYTRTEGTFMMVIFAVYLIIDRKWMYIPLMGAAFIVYSFVGYFSGHDFLWFFTENPYNATSPYGAGQWDHFTKHYALIYGTNYSICFILGFLILMSRIFKNKEYFFWKPPGPEFKIFCLVFVPTFVFFFFHVYAWGAGKYASAGLWRVMASVIPLGGVLCMYAVSVIYRIKFGIIRAVLVVAVLFTLVWENFTVYQYPSKAVKDEKVEREAAEWFKKVRKPGSKIYYAHAGIVFHADWNPFDPDNRECFGFPSSNCIPDSTEQKFYYLWDSYFSEFSCGNKLADIEKCTNLTKIKEFKEEDFRLIIFESKDEQK